MFAAHINHFCQIFELLVFTQFHITIVMPSDPYFTFQNAIKHTLRCHRSNFDDILMISFGVLLTEKYLAKTYDKFIENIFPLTFYIHISRKRAHVPDNYFLLLLFILYFPI